MQLNEWESRYRALGVGVAAMSYDSVDTLWIFHSEQALDYPLLHDAAARHVEAYGVRNEEYSPGHAAFGIPHPGVIFIDQAGMVRLKFAVPDYKERPPFEEIEARVQSYLEGGG